MSKLVLVLNCGSSSLKFAVVDAENGEEHLSGLAECLHLPEARIKWKLDGKHEAQLGNGAAHEEALAFMVETILASKPELSENLAVIGHRVVHGGEQFTQSALITDDVLKGIEDCATLAPLHNPAHIIGIKAAQNLSQHLKTLLCSIRLSTKQCLKSLTYTLFHTTYTKSTVSVVTACTVLHTYSSLVKLQAY